MKTASIKKLKLNVTNIKSTLLKSNKKLIKIQASNRKIMDADLRQKELSNKEKKIETPLVSKFKSTGKKISQKTGSMFSRIFEVLGLITAGIIINNIKTIIDKVKAIYTDLQEKINKFYEDNKGIFDLLGKFVNVLKDGVMGLLSLIGKVNVEKQEKDQDKTKKMVSELDSSKLKKIVEPITGLIKKIKEALQGKKKLDKPNVKESDDEKFLEFDKDTDQLKKESDSVEKNEKKELSKSLDEQIIDDKKSDNVTTTTNKKISVSRTVSGRFDMKTGKTYINEKEVSTDEYNTFANMSEKEKVQKYGQIKELSSSVNTIKGVMPQKNEISSNNLKYDSNITEGRQIIVLTKTKEKTKVVPVTVAV